MAATFRFKCDLAFGDAALEQPSLSVGIASSASKIRMYKSETWGANLFSKRNGRFPGEALRDMLSQPVRKTSVWPDGRVAKDHRGKIFF